MRARIHYKITSDTMDEKKSLSKIVGHLNRHQQLPNQFKKKTNKKLFSHVTSMMTVTERHNNFVFTS